LPLWDLWASNYKRIILKKINIPKAVDYL